MAATRIRDNQRLMVFLAGLVLVIAVVFGLLSRGHSAPAPATLPTVAAEPDPLDRQIDAVVQAIGDVSVTVTVDGVESTYPMAAGETRTFMAQTDLILAVTDGGADPADGEREGSRHPRHPGPALERTVQLRHERRGDAVGGNVRAEVVGVGTELLLGQIANTNARWISERLADDRRGRPASSGGRRQHPPDRRGAPRGARPSRRRAGDRRARADRGRPDAGCDRARCSTLRWSATRRSKRCCGRSSRGTAEATCRSATSARPTSPRACARSLPPAARPPVWSPSCPAASGSTRSRAFPSRWRR